MGRLTVMLALLTLLSGCEGCGDNTDTGGTTGESGEQTSGEESAGGDEEPVDPGPPPTLGLRIEPADDSGQNLIVENRGDEPVELATALVLERRDGDAFTTVEEIQGVALRYDCESETPECITLVPGAALHPPPWTGDIGDAQCACERCAAAPEGTYRFVVTTCGGGHRVESPAFER
jgi:hypothetical protein